MGINGVAINADDLWGKKHKKWKTLPKNRRRGILVSRKREKASPDLFLTGKHAISRASGILYNGSPAQYGGIELGSRVSETWGTFGITIQLPLNV